MRDFLDDLDLSSEERQRLRALGAPDARALREMYRAAPNDFEAYFGPRTHHLVEALDAVCPREVEPMQGKTTHVLGARLDPVPHVAPPKIDLELRDRLFQELQDLRNRPASPERDAAIADLEDQLNALLDESL